MPLKETRDTLKALFDDSGKKVALAYSGGKDSSVLLDMAKPYRDRVTVFWINTGFAFPHIGDHVRQSVEGFEFVEITHDLMAVWNEHGLPAAIVPMEHYAGIVSNPKRPLIQPWQECCMRRGLSLYPYLSEHGYTTLLLGQRKADGVKFAPSVSYQGIEVLYPLHALSDDDVWKYIADHAVELPQYTNKANTSMECSCCIIAPNAAHIDFMKEHYPALLADAKQVAKCTLSTVAENLQEKLKLLSL